MFTVVLTRINSACANSIFISRLVGKSHIACNPDVFFILGVADPPAPISYQQDVGPVGGYFLARLYKGSIKGRGTMA